MMITLLRSLWQTVLFRRLYHCLETKGSDNICRHGAYQVILMMMKMIMMVVMTKSMIIVNLSGKTNGCHC